MPGPSSTERGFPVLSTGSPTDTPAEIKAQGFFFKLGLQQLVDIIDYNNKPLLRGVNE